MSDMKAEPGEIFGGVPLTVVFADGETLAQAREGRANRIPLDPPFHVSDEDVYLVLPVDIGIELIEIFADADAELLEAAMREGLLVLGTIEREGRGKVVLEIEEAIVPLDALEGGMEYTSEVQVGEGLDATLVLNDLDQAQVTISSELIDDDGLESMLSSEMHIGASWRVPANADHLKGVDPTYAWSRRLPDGRVGIEAVLFSEYEELVIVLRPAVLAPVRRLARVG
jgi:hypothetical protein